MQTTELKNSDGWPKIDADRVKKANTEGFRAGFKSILSPSTD
jgi:hypothetical protein